MKSNLSKLFSLTAALVAFGTSAAMALPIVITTGNPGNAGTDNVLFNDSTLVHSGLIVQGNINGLPGYIVDFTSSSGSGQIMGGGGQAVIEGGEGNDPFTSLTFGLEAGATFTKAILNALATDDGTINFAVNYINAVGSPFMATFNVDGSGQNFFGIVAQEGAKIVSVTFSSMDTAFAEAKQFRLGGVAGPGTDIPSVPDAGATVMMLGAALAGLALVSRKRSA